MYKYRTWHSFKQFFIWRNLYSIILWLKAESLQDLQTLHIYLVLSTKSDLILFIFIIIITVLLTSFPVSIVICSLFSAMVLVSCHCKVSRSSFCWSISHDNFFSNSDFSNTKVTFLSFKVLNSDVSEWFSFSAFCRSSYKKKKNYKKKNYNAGG